MIYLRQLKEKDAPLMLEWMHDKEIQANFIKKMNEMDLNDITEFCRNSIIPDRIRNGTNIHFAIVDEEDEYMGTISLKNIDIKNMSAEYAVSTRKKAHGKNIAERSTNILLEKAFVEYGLHRVYLNVFADNIKAIRFYEKYGFKFEGEFRECLRKDGKYLNLRWYSILKDEFNKVMHDDRKK